VTCLFSDCSFPLGFLKKAQPFSYLKLTEKSPLFRQLKRRTKKEIKKMELKRFKRDGGSSNSSSFIFSFGKIYRPFLYKNSF